MLWWKVHSILFAFIPVGVLVDRKKSLCSLLSSVCSRSPKPEHKPSNYNNEVLLTWVRLFYFEEEENLYLFILVKSEPNQFGFLS